VYVGFEQITVSSTVLTQADLTIPAGASHVELQADTQSVRYTMDNSSDPTAAIGMILLVTEPPKLFQLEDMQRVRLIRGAGSDAKLNIHYIGNGI